MPVAERLVFITGLGRTLRVGCGRCLYGSALLPDTPEGVAEAVALRDSHTCPTTSEGGERTAPRGES